MTARATAPDVSSRNTLPLITVSRLLLWPGTAARLRGLWPERGPHALSSFEATGVAEQGALRQDGMGDLSRSGRPEPRVRLLVFRAVCGQRRAQISGVLKSRMRGSILVTGASG